MYLSFNFWPSQWIFLPTSFCSIDIPQLSPRLLLSLGPICKDTVFLPNCFRPSSCMISRFCLVGIFQCPLCPASTTYPPIGQLKLYMRIRSNSHTCTQPLVMNSWYVLSIEHTHFNRKLQRVLISKVQPLVRKWLYTSGCWKHPIAWALFSPLEILARHEENV